MKKSKRQTAGGAKNRPALARQQLAHLRKALEQLRQLLDADAALRAALNN